MASWDPTKVKSQIRLTAYHLAQIQQRHDQTSNITKQDVGTLISRGQIVIARSKVEKLVRDDKLSALIEALESYCNTLLERFMELGRATDFQSGSPILEAVCCIILAAPRTDIKDVIILREMFVQMYGQEFAQLAMQNHKNIVPAQIVDTLSKRPPPSTQIDVYMAAIAEAYQLPWTPPLLPHQKARALSEILDETSLPHVIDLQQLRRICSRGIPPQPPWLRPRVWKLLLGTLPPQKDSWEVEAHSKRQAYYELARRLLIPITTLPSPTTPLDPLDVSLLNLAKSLSPLPPDLDEELDASPLCPFDDNAPEGLRIETADAVDKRLQTIRRHIAGPHNVFGTPEIRLEIPADVELLQTPQISISSPSDTPPEGGVNRTPGTVLRSSASSRNHATSLLRLLYIHTTLHPSAPTTYLTSLLIPLYVALVRELEPVELAHIEADAFWLLTELWGEVGELAEVDSSQKWMIKFGRRLAWADPELWEDLNRKGLDPALPHYSYRWLTPMLTRTLPLPSLLTIWDTLFTRTSRTSDHNAKLEFLLDICTSMLIHARVTLFRLGKAAPKSPGLWGDVDLTVAPPSPTPIEFEEGFVQGMSFLQTYPMEELGGPERVIEIAVGFDNLREVEGQEGMVAPGLSEKFRQTVWSGFATKKSPTEHSPPLSDNESDGTPSPEWPDSGPEDEGDVTETPGRALLGKFGSTVWRGITNQSSMDAPPSPLVPSPAQLASPAGKLDELHSPNLATPDAAGIGSRLGNSIWRGLTNQSAMEAPPSPIEPSIPSHARSESGSLTSPSSLWSYTEKLKDSDAAAALSKASTNWTAKAATLWRRSNPSSPASSPEYAPHHARRGSLSISGKNRVEMFPKRGSLPSQYNKEYSPPPRPNFRESRYFQTEEHSTPGSPPRPVTGLMSPPDILVKSKSALASLTRSSQAQAPKTGPRPLLLSSSSLITPSNPRRLSRSPTPVPRSPQPQRDSMSSVSSTSTSLSGARYSYSDRESEPGSGGRFIPLRRGISPRPDGARPTARAKTPQYLSPGNESEPTHGTFNSSHPKDLERRTSSEDSVRRGWGRVDLPDSPSTLPSSPPPKTPVTSTNGANIHVTGATEQRGSMVIGERGDVSGTSIERKVGRKKSWNITSVQPASNLEGASDSSTSQDTGPRIRSKRFGQRPTNLRLKSDPDLHRSATSAIIEQKSPGDAAALTPESLTDTVATTPRATDFPSPGSIGRPPRVPRTSRSPRRSKKSDVPEKTNGSGGEEGDDEGYDEFLSAYESEENTNNRGDGIQGYDV